MRRRGFIEHDHAFARERLVQAERPAQKRPPQPFVVNARAGSIGPTAARSRIVLVPVSGFETNSYHAHGLGIIMPDWTVKLVEQVALLTAAPIPLGIAIVAAAAAIWVAVGWSYGVLSKNTQIETQGLPLSDYRDKPNGPTPGEANADLDLERMVASTIGSRWKPLNETEIAALSAKLADIPRMRVRIMYENALGKELAQSFFEAFKQARWDGATLDTGSGLGPGVTIGQGASTTTIALKSAIEAASRLKVEILRPDQPPWPGIILLAVGINSI